MLTFSVLGNLRLVISEAMGGVISSGDSGRRRQEKSETSGGAERPECAKLSITAIQIVLLIGSQSKIVIAALKKDVNAQQVRGVTEGKANLRGNILS